MDAIRVALVDDHPEIRSILIFILERAGGIEVVGEASSGEGALALVQQFSPDILILDMRMPGVDGAEVVRTLNPAESGVRILVLSHHLEKHTILELFNLGARGYIAKDEAFQWLVPAIQGMMKGERWVSPLVERQLSGGHQKKLS